MKQFFAFRRVKYYDGQQPLYTGWQFSPVVRPQVIGPAHSRIIPFPVSRSTSTSALNTVLGFCVGDIYPTFIYNRYLFILYNIKIYSDIFCRMFGQLWSDVIK